MTSGAIVSDQGVPANAQPRGGDETHAPPARGIPQSAIPIAFAVLLLVLATTSQGAFAIGRWAPLALFALAVLIGALIGRGGLVVRSRPVGIALGAIWGLAAWSMLSMLWAASSADAFEAGDRMVFYAAIATLPFALPLSRRSLAAAGWSITVGISGVAVFVLVRLLVHGAPLFLAGRLNAPVNYRNATALLFALPVWPLIVFVAARNHRRGLRAVGLGLAVLCLGLVVLTQTRGILIGLAAGGCVTLLVGPDRVRRAWVSALAIACVALASPWLLRPFHAFDGGSGYVSPHDITVAAWGLAISSVIAAVVGLLIALFDNGLRVNSPQMRHVRLVARIALAGAAALLLVVAAVAMGNPVTYAHSKWDEFTSLQYSTPSTTRYLTVGGQRYDLWRVALKEFDGAPLLGVGADNYSFGYYRERATNRNLNDPHSLVFALLSENGAVGTLLFIVFLVGMAAVLRRGWPTLSASGRRDAIAPAAAATVLLGQSTVDWIWLIPGLTAIGVFALSVAAAQAAVGAPADDQGAGGGVRRRPRYAAGLKRAGQIVAVGALVAATIGVFALFVSDAYIQRARTVVDVPSAELSAAQKAALFDPWSVTPHYLEASAYETMGNRVSAYKQLNDALSVEPENSATLGVLGDFEARGHDFAAARAYYRRALALNPLDTGLQQLAVIGESQPGQRDAS
jgi:hypothetical protein